MTGLGFLPLMHSRPLTQLLVYADTRLFDSPQVKRVKAQPQKNLGLHRGPCLYRQKDRPFPLHQPDTAPPAKGIGPLLEHTGNT